MKIFLAPSSSQQRCSVESQKKLRVSVSPWNMKLYPLESLRPLSLTYTPYPLDFCCMEHTLFGGGNETTSRKRDQ